MKNGNVSSIALEVLKKMGEKRNIPSMPIWKDIDPENPEPNAVYKSGELVDMGNVYTVNGKVYLDKGWQKDPEITHYIHTSELLALTNTTPEPQRKFETNLNHCILVKIKPAGLEHWKKEYTKTNSWLPVSYQRSFEEYSKKHEAGEDQYKMQMHDFIRYFGGHTVPTLDEFVEMSVMIEGAF